MFFSMSQNKISNVFFLILVATAIKFSSDKAGCAVLEFNPLRNTTSDAIAFGVQTKYHGPVLLMHIASHRKSLDFLRLELTTIGVGFYTVVLERKRVLLIGLNFFMQYDSR